MFKVLKVLVIVIFVISIIKEYVNGEITIKKLTTPTSYNVPNLYLGENYNTKHSEKPLGGDSQKLVVDFNYYFKLDKIKIVCNENENAKKDIGGFLAVNDIQYSDIYYSAEGYYIVEMTNYDYVSQEVFKLQGEFMEKLKNYKWSFAGAVSVEPSIDVDVIGLNDDIHGYNYKATQMFFGCEEREEYRAEIENYLSVCNIRYSDLYYTTEGYYSVDLIGYENFAKEPFLEELKKLTVDYLKYPWTFNSNRHIQIWYQLNF